MEYSSILHKCIPYCYITICTVYSYLIGINCMHKGGEKVDWIGQLTSSLNAKGWCWEGWTIEIVISVIPVQIVPIQCNGWCNLKFQFQWCVCMCTCKNNCMNDGRVVIFPAADGMQYPAYVVGFFSLQIRVLIIEISGLLTVQNCLFTVVIPDL